MKQASGIKSNIRKTLCLSMLAFLAAGAGIGASLALRAGAASGGISGRVTNESGAGIANIKVVLYVENASCHCSWTKSGETWTDGGGNYAFSGLATNSYGIKFDSAGLDYVSENYNNRDVLTGSFEKISVTDGSVTPNIDAQLAPAGRISGRVMDKDGVGIPNIDVQVQDPTGIYSTQIRYSAPTDSDGNYLITGVAGGAYQIFFHPYMNPDGYLSEWYNDKSTRAAADLVAVTAGSTTNINAWLTKGGQIKGRVIDPFGIRISGARVTARGTDVDWSRYTFTDNAGNYAITGLMAGHYQVEFYDENEPGYVTEWYDNKSSSETADLIAVAVESVIENINAQLALTGQIGGWIYQETGGGIGGVSVTAYPVDGSSSGIKSAWSDSNGNYAIKNLAPGQYHIHFENLYCVPEWYNDQASRETASAVTVISANLTPNINAILAKKPKMEVSKSPLIFCGKQGGPVSPPDSTILSNSGGGTLQWSVTQVDDWFSVSPSSGVGNAALTVGIVQTDLTPGTHWGVFYVHDPDAAFTSREVWVKLIILEEGTNTPPFGMFDKPADGATVASSIPVTGWALDDIGVQSVKIYRGTDLTDRIFIGDAVLVSGARPDVKTAYPNYPQNERAGWGYMLLTNFLPNGGNGPVNLLSYATDMEGNEILLGSKAIVCDNANAVKPFGAIDTPAQGGTALGSSFANFGWVLTPKTNSIPVDGSTITVWVDGLPLGHPVYNNYRADIATLFPGYANSNGAVGYYYLNTTGYPDGIHTIEWSAVDSAGNTDGIGSRYFMIQNAVPAPGAVAAESGIEKTIGRSFEDVSALPEESTTPVFVKRGLAENAPVETVLPGEDGSIHITLPEVTRLAVYWNEEDAMETFGAMADRGARILNRSMSSRARFEAYQLAGDELRPIPIGASFDSKSGAFYWQAGPGFIGEYVLVLVKNGDRNPVKKTFKVVIVPKS